jgi:hypothetical protein
MAKLTVKQIRQLARTIVLANPGGIRYTPLVQQIFEGNPETPIKAISISTYNLATLFPDQISKPSRGLFMPVAQSESDVTDNDRPEQITPTGTKVREEEFYQSFAEWLVNEDEVNHAVPLGGTVARSRWGTPDVVGTYKSTAGNLIKFGPEIVAAEIKTEPSAPVVAFGQAVTYRLFATKTYIAMPKTLTEFDQTRLDALCMLFGVGLVFFDLNKDAPNYSIRVRAQRFLPDMFYVNKFADMLKSYNLAMFEKLF